MCQTLEVIAKVEKALLLRAGGGAKAAKTVALGVACGYAAVLASLRGVLPHFGDHVAEHVRLFVVGRAAPLYILHTAYDAVFRETAEKKEARDKLQESLLKGLCGVLWLLADKAQTVTHDVTWAWPLKSGLDGELQKRLNFALGERAAGLPKVLLKDEVTPEVKLQVRLGGGGGGVGQAGRLSSAHTVFIPAMKTCGCSCSSQLRSFCYFRGARVLHNGEPSSTIKADYLVRVG